MPNSQRGVFASNGYAGYWRRVQKSFVDYVGSDVIGRVPNPAISSALTSNKRLSLPTVGIISTAMSSKTGFADGTFLCFVDFKAFFLHGSLDPNSLDFSPFSSFFSFSLHYGSPALLFL